VAALSHQIADVCRVVIDGATLSLAKTTTRAALPIMRVEDLPAGVVVTTMPSKIEFEKKDRSNRIAKVSVDIAVQKKVADEINATIDPLSSFLEEVSDLFHGLVLEPADTPDSLDGGEDTTTIELIYSQDQLYQNKMFFGLITVTFRIEI